MLSLTHLTLAQRQTYNRGAMREHMLTPLEEKELAGSELLRGAPDDFRVRFNRLWKRKTLRAGETLMTANEPGHALYFVLTGTVKIHVEQADGSDVFIDISGAGDIVGEMSIVDNVGRSATATAMEETRVLWMERAAIETELNLTPLLSQNVARILSQRLRHATTRIQVMATQNTYGRVAHQLLFLQDKYGRVTPDGVLIPIRLTQSELADLVGATRERVNQVMGKFKREKILAVDSGNHLTILDAEALWRYEGKG